MLGKVKWFDEKKGYGFITSDDGYEYFFHYSSIISDDDFKTLLENQKVSFEVDTKEENRLRAKSIRKIE